MDSDEALDKYILIALCFNSENTVKPVLSGPVLNGRPVLSGQMSKS